MVRFSNRCKTRKYKEGIHALRLGGVPSGSEGIVVLAISSPVVASWVLFVSEAIAVGTRYNFKCRLWTWQEYVARRAGCEVQRIQ